MFRSLNQFEDASKTVVIVCDRNVCVLSRTAILSIFVCSDKFIGTGVAPNVTGVVPCVTLAFDRCVRIEVMAHFSVVQKLRQNSSYDLGL